MPQDLGFALLGLNLALILSHFGRSLHVSLLRMGMFTLYYYIFDASFFLIYIGWAKCVPGVPERTLEW